MSESKPLVFAATRRESALIRSMRSVTRSSWAARRLYSGRGTECGSGRERDGDDAAVADLTAFRSNLTGSPIGHKILTNINLALWGRNLCRFHVDKSLLEREKRNTCGPSSAEKRHVP
jgi:hypothetical protein